MTLYELGRRYSIGYDKLRYFADNHLIRSNQDYTDNDLHRLGTMCILYDIGLDAESIKRFMDCGDRSMFDEQMNILNMHRRDILDNVHREQKNLDSLDYMLYTVKSRGGI